MNKINLALIVGTSRKGSKSLLASKSIQEIASKRGDVEVVLVDPAEINMPGDGHNEEDRSEEYANITQEADAFFIVTPEYNHGYPGSLKRLLDMEFENYYHKPVVVAGVSAGSFGGTRVIESLIPVIHRLGMIVIDPEVPLPKISELLGDNNQIEDEYIVGNINRALDHLVWFANAMNLAKKELPKPGH